MVTYTCNPRTWRLRQEDCHKAQASLGYGDLLKKIQHENKPDVAVHILIPELEMQRQADLSELKASLVYRPSCRTDR